MITLFYTSLTILFQLEQWRIKRIHIYQLLSNLRNWQAAVSSVVKLNWIFGNLLVGKLIYTRKSKQFEKINNKTGTSLHRRFFIICFIYFFNLIIFKFVLFILDNIMRIFEIVTTFSLNFGNNLGKAVCFCSYCPHPLNLFHASKMIHNYTFLFSSLPLLESNNNIFT